MVEAAIDYGDGLGWTAVFILELRGAKIAKLIAYWAKPFAPADLRPSYIERPDQ
jgi:hypothetical protein